SLPTCETAGIFNAASAMVGAIQAGEALRLLLGETPSGVLFVVDGWHPDIQRIHIGRRSDCPTCVQGEREYLGAKRTQVLASLCVGFDTPVACHLMARQGLDLIAAHFSLEPITDDTAAMKARSLCGILRIPSLYVVRVGEAFAEVAQKANRRFYFILTKRLMVRLADAIADLEGAEVLVTGENLGQVSSQTVASLRAIDAVAHHPILRPLIGFDK